MESRSYALLAGAFSLLLLTGVILVAIFLTRDGTRLIDYDIVSTRAVSGLSEQSAVLYQGVPVGKVQFLNLDPNAPGRVHIRIGVAIDTPITEGTWAELAMQGITGLATIELHDDGSSTVRLAAEGEGPPTIPLRPGLFARLSEGGGNIIDNIERISLQLATLLNDRNMQTIQAAMHSAAAASGSWSDIGEQLQPIIAKLDPLVVNLNDASLEARGVARDISALTREARSAISHLDAQNGPLVMATRSLREIAYAAARLSGDTLPAVSRMANDVSSAARDVSTIAHDVGDMPQSIIFGLPPPKPGPGEPGFQGFGRAQ